MSQRNIARAAYWGLLLGLVTLHAGAVSASKMPLRVDRIEPSSAGVTFDFELEGDLPRELLRRLDDGDAVTITFKIEIVREKKLWPNPNVARLHVVRTARLDPLTRHYLLFRREGGTDEPAGQAADRDGALRWLTRVTDATVDWDADRLRGKRLVYRVQAVLSKRLAWLFVPVTVRSQLARGPVTAP